MLCLAVGLLGLLSQVSFGVRLQGIGLVLGKNMGTQEALQTNKQETKMPTAVLVWAILLIGLLPIHAAYYAFTRNTPLWLQWLIIGMLSVGGFYLIVVCLLEWRTTSLLRRWLGLFLAIAFVVGLDGLFLFTSGPFLTKLGDSCFGFVVLSKASDYLIKRVERKPHQPAT